MSGSRRVAPAWSAAAGALGEVVWDGVVRDVCSTSALMHALVRREFYLKKARGAESGECPGTFGGLAPKEASPKWVRFRPSIHFVFELW